MAVCTRLGKLRWCQRRELNPRPKAYESSALPLSYSGTKRSAENYMISGAEARRGSR